MKSEPSFPAIPAALRLRPAVETIFEATALLPRIYVHCRNNGAELAAIHTLAHPVVDEEQNIVLFPENGLSLDLRQLLAVHATHIERLVKPALGLEFDFRNCATALSLVALDEAPDHGNFAAAIRSLGEATIPESDLARAREQLDPPACICPNCHEASQRRMRYAANHPLTLLLEDAARSRLPLLCRLQSEHLGMATWMIPGRVKLRDGCVEAIDAGGHGLLQIKLQFAHSLWVLPLQIDGEPFSAIRVYDMLGNLTLELATPDPDIEDRWRDFCEGDHTFYRTDP